MASVAAPAPALDGIHHLKLPVSDLERSLAWYQDRLGYQVMHEFVEDGVRMGISMTHPNGGPDFAIGVPGREAIEALAAAFTERGDHHTGVERTPVGWVLLGLHDPDGHAVRFYTVPLELPPGFERP